MQWANHFFINQTRISLDSPPISSQTLRQTMMGILSTKELFGLQKSAGANCAKFQHFQAEKIVSDWLRHLSDSKAIGNGKICFEVYKQYECQRDW